MYLNLLLFFVFLNVSKSFFNNKIKKKDFKLNIKYFIDNPEYYNNIFDKFEYYSLKNDTINQRKCLEEILTILKRNETNNNLKID